MLKLSTSSKRKRPYCWARTRGGPRPGISTWVQLLSALSVSVIGGQVVLGQLTKKPFRQTPVTKNVALFIVGLDLSKGIQDLKGFEVSRRCGHWPIGGLGLAAGRLRDAGASGFSTTSMGVTPVSSTSRQVRVGGGFGGLWIGRTGNTSVFISTGGGIDGVITRQVYL